MTRFCFKCVALLVQLLLQSSIGQRHLCGVALRKGKRDQMEDRAQCLCPLIDDDVFPFMCFLSVYDGHGGSHVSQYLANYLYRRIRATIQAASPEHISPESIQTVLAQSIESIDNEIQTQSALLSNETTVRDSGSTAVIAILVEDQYIVVANVGNSGAVVCSSHPSKCHSSRSRVMLKTWPHSPGVKEEKRRIELTGANVSYTNRAWRIDGGLELSRSLGDESYRDKGVISSPTLSLFAMNPSDGFVILASDGVFDSLHCDDICTIVEESRLGCPRRCRTQPQSPPIALRGETLLVVQPKNDCEPLRLGMNIQPGDILHGLRGCSDCYNQKSCNDIDRSLFLNAGDNDDVATMITDEAYNRGATDNLAVALIDLKPVARNDQHAVISVSDAMIHGSVVLSDNTNRAYRLLHQVMHVPRTRHQLSRDIISAADHEETFDQDSEQCMVANSKDRSLMLFQSTERIPRRVSLESCIPSHYLEAVDFDLFRALATLPRYERLPLSSSGTSDSDATPTTFSDLRSRYKLGKKFAGGGFGEIWKAVRHGADDTTTDDETGFVLKRIKTEKGKEALLSGLREAYFGSLLKQTTTTGTAHLVRFVESFELNYAKDLWLVFRDEGVSLHDLMYTSEGADGVKVVETSSWWRQLRQSDENMIFETRLIQQLLEAVHVLHAQNITHRDIKPENVLIEGGAPVDARSFNIRLIDFGSAIDAYSMEKRYGETGPSDKEQTREYAPPEALFEKLVYVPELASHYYAYDMWSIGVLWLEYILGTPHIFELPDRTRAHLAQELQLYDLSDQDKEKAFLLRAMMEFCIYPPGSFIASEGHHAVELELESKRQSLTSWACTEKAMFKWLRSRDVHSIGISSTVHLRILMSMLAWNPYERATAENTLRHLTAIQAS